MCNCKEQPVLIDISNNHAEFKGNLHQLEVGDWVLLMSCPDCNQLWKVDEWDKYQTCYAVKIPPNENWQLFDSEAIIKEQMVKNRGGLEQDNCICSGCEIKRVKGSVYCVNHLYEGGTRA